MQDKIFATVFGLQRAEIEHFCFDLCGKIIVGAVDDNELGPLCVCREANCPYLDKEMDEPLGTVPEGMIYLRKLKDLPGNALSKIRATEPAIGADTHAPESAPGA